MHVDPDGDIVRRGYDSCAESYRDARNQFENEKHVEGLAERFKEGARILDLGCGAGVPIDGFFLDRGFDVTGVDISPRQIRLAQERFPNGIFIRGDMRDIDLPEESFDAVVSFYAIFHIPREDHAQLLKRVHHLIREGGYFLATMGAAEWEGTEENIHGARMFWSHYGREKNLEMVREAGFKIVFEQIDTTANEQHLVVLAQKPPVQRESEVDHVYHM